MRRREQIIETHYYSVNGTGMDDCCYLAQRYDAERGYKPEEAECWVISHKPGKGKYPITVKCGHGTTGWLTGIWRSLSGTAYVSGSSSGCIHVNPDILAKDSQKKWQDYFR